MRNGTLKIERPQGEFIVHHGWNEYHVVLAECGRTINMKEERRIRYGAHGQKSG